MYPQIYGQLIFNKAGKNVQWEKRKSLQQMVLGKLDSDMLNNEPGLISYTIHKKGKIFHVLGLAEQTLLKC